MTVLPYLDAATVTAALTWPTAIDAIAAAVAVVDAVAAPARTSVPIAAGELLLMPAELGATFGVKVLTIAPGNPAHGRPRIQGLYVLFDPRTCAPLAVLDGAALTALRTPAVSAFAVDQLAAAAASTLVVFGAGPQAEAHVHAIASIRALRSVTVVGRDQAHAGGLVDRLTTAGLDAVAGTDDAVASADIVVCATTAREPLFDGRLLAATGCVVAIGSHEPDARELDDTVLRRADLVVVEDRATALRQAGDVIIAVDHGVLDVGRLIPIGELAAAGRLHPSTGISVFKSVGMGWQDLAIATAIATHALA